MRSAPSTANAEHVYSALVVPMPGWIEVTTDYLSTLRRHLGDASRLAAKDLVIPRSGDELYLGVEPASEKPRRGRRGRWSKPEK